MSAARFGGIQLPKETTHTQDIDLAYRTLQFIGSLTDEELKAHPNIPNLRDVVANVCDFQHRFSLPMALPFGLGNDLKQKLDTPRPVEALARFRVAYPVPATVLPVGTKNDDDTIKSTDGKVYAMAGQKTWALLVQQGLLTGADAVAPVTSANDWLKDLFAVLVVSKTLDTARRATARRLASCWYYVSTQVNFIPLTEEEREEETQGTGIMVDPTGMLVQLIAGGALAAQGLGGGDEADAGEEDEEEGVEGEESDEEDGDDAMEDVTKKVSLLQLLQGAEMGGEDGETGDVDYDPEADPDQGEDDDVDEEEEEESDEEGEAKAPALADLLASAAKNGEGEDEEDNDFDPAAQQGEDEDDEDVQMGENDEEGGEDYVDEGDMPPDMWEIDEAILAKESEFRTSILKNIDELGAYLPDPTQDVTWLKRILKDMSTSAKNGDLAWYPWGVPPLEPLKKSLTSSDQHEVQHAANILRMFVAQQ